MGKAETISLGAALVTSDITVENPSDGVKLVTKILSVVVTLLVVNTSGREEVEIIMVDTGTSGLTVSVDVGAAGSEVVVENPPDAVNPLTDTPTVDAPSELDIVDSDSLSAIIVVCFGLLVEPVSFSTVGKAVTISLGAALVTSDTMVVNPPEGV